jgi:hypothetical protein
MGGGARQGADGKGGAGRARRPGAEKLALGGGPRWCQFCRQFGVERREESGEGP